MKIKYHIIIAAITAASITNSYCQTIITTFECAGIYWKKDNDGLCKMHYKEALNGSWKQGLDLVYDPRDGEYRGSIYSFHNSLDDQIDGSGMKRQDLRKHMSKSNS